MLRPRVVSSSACSPGKPWEKGAARASSAGVTPPNPVPPAPGPPKCRLGAGDGTTTPPPTAGDGAGVFRFAPVAVEEATTPLGRTRGASILPMLSAAGVPKGNSTGLSRITMTEMLSRDRGRAELVRLSQSASADVDEGQIAGTSPGVGDDVAVAVTPGVIATEPAALIALALPAPPREEGRGDVEPAPAPPLFDAEKSGFPANRSKIDRWAPGATGGIDPARSHAVRNWRVTAVLGAHVGRQGGPAVAAAAAAAAALRGRAPPSPPPVRIALRRAAIPPVAPLVPIDDAEEPPPGAAIPSTAPPACCLNAVMACCC